MPSDRLLAITYIRFPFVHLSPPSPSEAPPQDRAARNVTSVTLQREHWEQIHPKDPHLPMSETMLSPRVFSEISLLELSPLTPLSGKYTLHKPNAPSSSFVLTTRPGETIGPKQTEA